jgi:hypothetical protein
MSSVVICTERAIGDAGIGVSKMRSPNNHVYMEERGNREIRETSESRFLFACFACFAVEKLSYVRIWKDSGKA